EDITREATAGCVRMALGTIQELVRLVAKDTVAVPHLRDLRRSVDRKPIRSALALGRFLVTICASALAVEKHALGALKLFIHPRELFLAYGPTTPSHRDRACHFRGWCRRECGRVLLDKLGKTLAQRSTHFQRRLFLGG